MAYLLIFFPLFITAIAAVIKSNRWRPLMLPLASVPHFLMTIYTLITPGMDITNSSLKLDPPGKLILLVVSTLFLFCSFYAVPYLRYRKERKNRLFCSCLITFLSTMSLVTWAQHLGMLWVAIEATTLVTAPLIYFNHTQFSIEAMWKYLLVGSVGIAMALLGTFFLAYASIHVGLEATLNYSTLIENAPRLSKIWLHLAFILLLIGYGTKMGLAPMHTWKPDAYGESPGVVGAIFAGGITSCAFLALLRVYHICYAANEGSYVSRLLIFMGLLSMAVAALFMIRQRDLKRMLAYSSIEHMGILIIGLGIGVPALFGTLLHVITNGLTKGVLFLSVGNIHRAYGSKNIDHVHGALRLLPLSGTMFLAGFLAITGSPPFGPFVSEFAILNGAFSVNKYWVGGGYLALLMLVFIGMGATVLSAIQGVAPGDISEKPKFRDGLTTGAPILGLMVIVLILGIYIPTPLQELINDAVVFLGGQR
ncbi:MAG TPA: proton-conducting transporter membrane subunit [Chitinispirillaceae bacterium]|nr:proton-conducting transporter membrane subunit [Chitinispirillaceae bacterium]